MSSHQENIDDIGMIELDILWKKRQHRTDCNRGLKRNAACLLLQCWMRQTFAQRNVAVRELIHRRKCVFLNRTATSISNQLFHIIHQNRCPTHTNTSAYQQFEINPSHSLSRPKQSLSETACSEINTSAAIWKKIPFPGIRSSVLDKIKWLKAIETEYDDILEDSCYMTMAPEAEEAVKDILLKTAPDEIRVDFILSKKQLNDIAGAMGHNDKSKFVKNFRKYHDIANKSENDDALAGFLDTFEKCKRWIDQTNQVPSKSDPDRGDVLLASVKSKKDTSLTKILFPTMNDLGIGDYVCGAEPGEHEMNHYKWSVQEKIGENMYSGIHDVDSGNDNNGVHWSMHLKTHSTEDESEAEREFRKLLKDQTNASKDRGNPKINMLIDREDLPKNIKLGNCSGLLDLIKR